MFKYIVLFVAALATILPAVSAVSISVRLGEQDLPLAVGPNEDFVKAAEAFCAQHGISADNVGQLVNALEQEASREMQAQALFHVPVTVDDKTLSMPYYQGTDPVDAARAFAEENGIPTSEDILRQLAQAIVDKANENIDQSSEPRVLASFPVSTGDQQLTLELREGQTIEQAVDSFLTAHNLPEVMEGVNNRQVLAEALSSRLAQSSRRLLFTLDVSINDAISTLEFYEGQEPYEAARNFLVEHGLKDSEDFENFHSAIVNGIREKLSALTAEQEQAAQTEKQQDPLENKLSIPVTIGEEVFTVYFDKGTTVNDVSSAFCTQKLDTVRAAMNEDVSLEVCTEVLQNSILESMRKGE